MFTVNCLSFKQLNMLLIVLFCIVYWLYDDNMLILFCIVVYWLYDDNMSVVIDHTYNQLLCRFLLALKK